MLGRASEAQVGLRQGKQHLAERAQKLGLFGLA